MQLFGCTVEVLAPPPSHHHHHLVFPPPPPLQEYGSSIDGPPAVLSDMHCSRRRGGGRKSPVVSVLMEQGGGGVGVPEGVYKRASFVCRGGGGWCVGVGGWGSPALMGDACRKPVRRWPSPSCSRRCTSHRQTVRRSLVGCCGLSHRPHSLL